MEIFASFYQDGVTDCFTLVHSERNPLTVSYTMLATDYEPQVFSQCTEGTYDPNGDNEHVGQPVGTFGNGWWSL
jgi:hypothetical protein